VLAIFPHALSFFIISFCLVTPRRVSLCLIMFPFIYHVPSCYLYNITLPTVARDPLTVELTMLRLLDHDARAATGEEDLEVEVKVAQERLVVSPVAAVVPEVEAPLPVFLQSNGKRTGITPYTVIWPAMIINDVAGSAEFLQAKDLSRNA